MADPQQTPGPQQTSGDPDDDLVLEQTRTTEAEDARIPARADRPPTADEERRAEELAGDVDPGVGEHYREMGEIGADVEGEGRIGT
jgi:hypothetical protein